jgi:hypothetical protein
MSASLTGRFFRNCAMAGVLAASVLDSAPSDLMSAASGGLPCCNSPAVALVRSDMALIASPMGVLSCARPVTSC